MLKKNRTWIAAGLMILAVLGLSGSPPGEVLPDVPIPPESEGLYEPGILLVDFEDDQDAGERAEFAAARGLVLEDMGELTAEEGVVRARLLSGSVAGRAGELTDTDEVEFAEPDYIYHAYYEPNDPQYKFQWHMRKIRAAEAWDVTEGKGVTVAVIDTGVAYENYKNSFRVKDLAGAEFVKPYNFVDDNEHANDDHGHGTHVAGTIAQTTNNEEGVVGVAYKARIMPLKVLNRRGGGSVSAIAKSVRYAADNGAKVINMSLGGPLASRVLMEACDYAKKKGTILVCAAGNSSQRGRQGAIGYPAKYKSCMAVSSVRDDDTRAWYSSYGKELAIAAPGGDTAVDQNNDGMPDGVLQNTINPNNTSQEGYFPFQGTSMAAPHVAGAAALVASLGVTDPDAIQKVLMSTARKPETGYNWDEYGAGILDAYAAVNRACFWYDLFRMVLALALTVLVYRRIRSRTAGGYLLSPGYLVGMLVGSCGFFFVLLAEPPFLPFKQFLLSGYPQWGIALLGAEVHEDPFFYSAATPILLALLTLGSVRWRQFAAGFSLGVGAHLLFAALADLGSMQLLGQFEKPWLLVNGLVCLVITYLIFSIIAHEKG